MLRKTQKIFSLAGLILLLVSITAMGTAQAEVIIQATPDNGVQPRIVVDADGGVHLLYFKKRLRAPSAREGNLYYRQYVPEKSSFGVPIKVSSRAYNLQTFSIARAGMALDGEGRVHVFWYLPRESQFFYSRSNPERNRFEPQQPMVSEYGEGIDAGGDVAAFGDSVAVVWAAGDLSREYERTVFARMSTDNGANFGPELRLSNPDLGACACCALAADYTDDSSLQVAYRSAIDSIGRHMQLLTVDLQGEAVSATSYGPVNALQQWEISFCPLSTNDIALDVNSDQWLVFETESRIIQINLQHPQTPMAIAEPFTETRQKNPAIAFNTRNEHLIAWGEAISHTRGGRLNIRVFAADGKSVDYQLPKEITIPNYSFPAVAGLANGDFLVLY